MLAMLRLTALLVKSTWPQLVAWFLAGTLARYTAIEIAGTVGAHNATAGVLLLPLAVLGRLAALVAMLLVLRSGIMALRGVTPLPRAERNRDFGSAVLTGMLPFVAFYAARGYLGQDVSAYTNRVLEVTASLSFAEAAATPTGVTQPTEQPLVAGALAFTPVTVAIIVAAFSLRWLWGRYRTRLPRGFQVAAVYLELLWVYLTVTLIADGLALLTGWIEARQAMVWLSELRNTVGDWFGPLLVAWDALVVALAFIAKVTLEPLAWLAMAGVIYGQTLKVDTPAVANERVTRVKQRYEAVPAQLRRRVTDLSGGITSRFTPIWKAVVLMWRAGPALIGAYVLGFTLVLMAQQLLEIGVVRLIGPHDLQSFWMVADTLILLTVPLVIEPLRMALVASAHTAAQDRLLVSAQPATVLAAEGAQPQEVVQP